MAYLKLLGVVALLLNAVDASPASAATSNSKFTYYDSLTPFAGPCDLTTGPDGAIWAQNILSDLITRVDPKTGKVEEYKIPYDTATNFSLVQNLEPGRTALACAIQPGKDGNLYAAAGVRSQFLRINPTTKEIKVYTPPFPNTPLGNLLNFNDLWADDKGMYFTLTTANVLFYFEYSSETFTPYIPPTPAAGPLGTFKASDGNIWICEFFAQKMAKFDVKTKTFTEYPLTLPAGAGPAVVRAESPKGIIWFTCFLGNSMGSINIHTGEVKIISDPLPGSFPTEDTVDGQGNIWYSTATRATLNKLDPKSGKITMVKQPTSDILSVPITIPPPLDIAVHYGPGNAIWFTEVFNNRIGRYQL